MRLVFAGTPAVALPALQAVHASRHELLAVLTRPDAAQGRSKRLVPSPVATWAHDRGVEVMKPPSAKDPALATRLAELAPDCCPVVAYGGLIPAPLLAVPRRGWINVHFSLLPAWRGAAPVQRAIQAGDRQTGVTIFELVPELDAGPVYDVRASPLGERETAGDVLGRLADEGAARLLAVLDAIESGRRPEPQANDGVTLAPKLTVADARIDWSQPADVIDRLIRACNPNPVAWTTLAGERFKVHLARPHSGPALAPGSLEVSRGGVFVGTGAGDLELLSVQPAGKRAMEAAAWARGVTSGPGGFE